MKVQFLHGTESGTAEMLCDDLAKALPSTCPTSVISMDDIEPENLEHDSIHVFVCSTFGSGDLPETAVYFYETLQKKRPDLSEITFAIFGLGDRSFGDTFAQGSEKLMQALQDCGAKMTGKRGVFDALSSSLPEDVALPWLAETLGLTLDAA
ncbi:MAG: flavodoxin domain-containing protein [Pseudomonadota bacterium]